MRKLDETDRRILREMQRNARITNTELAERVGLSPTPCWNRVRSLEKAGIIKEYVTIFDEQALGVPDTILVEVALEHHDENTLERVGQAIADLPEVLEAYLVTGDYDFFIKAAVSGTAGYERFLREGLYRIPGIRNSRSSFALKALKRTYSLQP